MDESIDPVIALVANRHNSICFFNRCQYDACHRSAWAAIAKHDRLGGLNTEMYFLTVLEAGSLRAMWPGSGEGSLSGL